MNEYNMNQQNLSQSTFEQIIKYGVYYNPASKHYASFGESNVACDKCHKSNLNVCIGYQNYDLCVSCVQKINESSSNKIFNKPLTSKSPFVVEPYKSKPAHSFVLE